MRICKKLLTLVVCMALLLCLLPVNASAASDFPTVLAEAKKGVAQIYCVGEDPLFLTSWVGTGFAVGNQGEDSDVFLTNWHVVTGDGEYELEDVRIWILQENCEIDQDTLEPDPGKSIQCKVLKTTTGYPDYAIIQATEPVTGYKALSLLSSEEVLDGTTVYALGYPAVVGEASATHYGIDDITSTNGIVSQHMEYALGGNTWVLMHTATISGGNSGGPLITEQGAVVGLNTYGFGEHEENMNRYCAVYIDYAMDGLDALNIGYDLFGEETTTETTEGKTDKEDTDDKEDQKDGEKKDDGEETDLTPILIGAGVVLAVIVLIVVLVQQKKKKEQAEALRRRQEAERRRQQEEARRQEAERQRQEAERLRQEEQRRREQEVKANVQLNKGMIYPVRAVGGTVGREKDCMIVLPEGMPGVSRHHCRLEFRGDTLVLTDLNSTYGTFIHGKRVPPNTPVALKSGSSFCLGSEKCTLTVC